MGHAGKLAWGFGLTGVGLSVYESVPDYQSGFLLFMENKSWWDKNWWIPILGSLLVLWIIATMLSNNTSSTAQSASNNNNLNASVQFNSLSLWITNHEHIDWTNCMVGMNGGSGWNFNNPPYQTRINLTLPASTTTIVPFTKITTTDGAIFDMSTHTINNVVIECFEGTENIRYWIGS